MDARTAALSVLIACAAGAVATTAAAQGAAGYPAKLIRLIIPFAPGGAPDFVGRIIALRWSELAGQNILIENRAGASGNIGLPATPDALRPGVHRLV